MKILKIAAACCAFFLLGNEQRALATSIIVIATPSKVVMASDTKSRQVDSSTGDTIIVTNAKIHEVNDYFMAMSGAVDLISFSPESLLISHLKQKAQGGLFNAPSFVHECSNALKNELKLNGNKSTFPRFKNQQLVFDAIIVGQIQKSPYLLRISCYNGGTPNKPDLRIAVSSLKVKDLKGPEVTCIGEKTETKRFFVENSPDSVPEKLYDQLEEAIKLQSIKSPDKVGLPVQIVEMETNKPGKWIRKLS